MRNQKSPACSRRYVRSGIAALLSVAGVAAAGGTPENILLIVNPSSQESMYLGNYYRLKRNIPERNVLYIDPGAADYTAFAGPNGNIDAVLGTLANRRLGDHIDYIVVAGTDRFYIDAPGRVADACWPVARFSQSSVYTMAHIRGQLLAGVVPSGLPNQYYSTNTANVQGFDSNVSYLSGSASTSPSARRYFIGAQLGYTGERGTTLGDIFQMIDRSVAVDGAAPAGKFYYMNNLADPIRNIRACGSLAGCSGVTTLFTNAVNAVTGAGGSAEIIDGILPAGRSDCLGILTGAEFPDIDNTTMTILPGAFCDHLTSWAATFDNANQVKMSAWIRRGASGTSGTVEEPCAYPGKFPQANMHPLYLRGLSLGEAHLRSLAYTPFQQLLLGDPMTRPWATFPTITPNIAGGTVSGTWTFTPSATTSLAGASIDRIELYIDGALSQTRGPGAAFSVPTGGLANGHHDVRLLAYDNTTVANVGRWAGSVRVANGGNQVQLNVSLPSAELTTPISASISTTGTGIVQEFRLTQNGRVIASHAGNGPVQIYGRTLGAGRSLLKAEVAYTDGTRAVSDPFEVNVAYTGGAASAVPVAYSYTRRVMRASSAVVELPASFPDNPAGVAYTVLSAPAQATMGGGAMNYRVLTVPQSACGTETLTFRATSPSGQSNIGTVTLIYDNGPCVPDMDLNGLLNIADFTFYLETFAFGSMRADMDGNCTLNIADFTGYLQAFAFGCP